MTTRLLNSFAAVVATPDELARKYFEEAFAGMRRRKSHYRLTRWMGRARPLLRHPLLLHLCAYRFRRSWTSGLPSLPRAQKIFQRKKSCRASRHSRFLTMYFVETALGGPRASTTRVSSVDSVLDDSTDDSECRALGGRALPERETLHLVQLPYMEPHGLKRARSNTSKAAKGELVLHLRLRLRALADAC